MIRIPAGTYHIGTNEKIGFEYDFETPRTEVTIEGFYIDETTVTNEEFLKFVTETGYVTEAEKIGWSYVFKYFLDDSEQYPIEVHKTPWWIAVEGASWRHPEGPHSSIEDRLDHPVVHVTRNDAVAYCQWAGKRLPTEAEWEIAAQGGTDNEQYYWGDELVFDGKHVCNTWQGDFPNTNTLDDGYASTAPVRTYPPNPYGLYQMIGNVWEWCVNPGKIELVSFQKVSGKDFWHVHQVQDDELYAIKGGSFLCHFSYCNRYRMCARNSNTAMSSSQNMGFRCVKDID
ncbi:Sulfatase modifying factor 1 precursor (C-alpha-formyglycine-generating enzyme 1) [Streptococcus oralis]|uniref:Sulfatase modifying factor 1 (C-alpha-formyglycine-generating enzyme 1) n=1 Tax=Streptococcus oralis TaxID=1303 RepID=A0A139M8C4_STROR|nr:formylglycine-generating enzyme family protein [Streptococcus oralis]KXT59924.1 Sulfatase modifying factor 1 precursor (C-alpha-formyglycine-generating enzyme 1) [Streptococcus oralis]